MTTEPSRQTSRTTRMIEDAQRLSQAGRAVYVVVSNVAHAAMLKRGLPEGSGIKIETFDSLRNLVCDGSRIYLSGAHPNCVVLIDHHAIERRYAAILEMMHRYDNEQERRHD